MPVAGRGQTELSELEVEAIVDCTGIVKNPGASNNYAACSMPFSRASIRCGWVSRSRRIARSSTNMDPQRDRLYAIGPLTRAAFWEIVAVPDIGQQCAELAARLRSRDPS
ncbi:hypothetical protein [Bradyrhizobium elkanii]|uniref:hypothetical protein n=1 Tax=Bradyrhizobium elkanii TaxID=29448 RepID=UPI0035169886